MNIQYKTRHFNIIRSCEDISYLKKGSNNKEKILNEFNFLSQIPEPIKKYFPEVKNLLIEENFTSYEIKKIQYSDFANSLVSGLINPEHVSGILKEIEIYFSKLPKISSSEENFKQKFFDLFINKNRNRFQLTKTIDFFDDIDAVFINAGYKNMANFIDLLSKEIEDSLPKFSDQNLYFSHGDLCFSNMFYSPLLENLMLIDPRGYKDQIEETYLPIYYDLAKLSHSFVGLYDFTAHEMYSLETSKNSYELKINIKDYLKILMRESFKDFLQNMKIDFAILRLLEATLFTSMIPLHKESKNRVIAHSLNAIKCFNDYQKHTK